MNFNDEYLKMFDELLNLKEKINVIYNDFYINEELNKNLFIDNPFLKKIKQESCILNDNFFVWNYKVDDYDVIPMGEFHLKAIEEVISPNNKLLIENDNNIIIEVFPFDDHPNSGDGVMGCIRFFDQTYQIWLHTENGELILMKIDLKDYIKITFELKAIFSWQYFFTDINWKSLNNSVIKKSLIERLSILKKCFPDFNENKFLDRLI